MLENKLKLNTDKTEALLKSKPTSCLLDAIPTSLLLKCIDDLLPTLTNIISFSSSSGTFSLTFRSAAVKPLLKKASLDANKLKTFRPVSDLSFVSKITEKIVLQQLLVYRTKHNLFCPSRSAGRPHRGTKTALFKIANDILLARDSGIVSLLTLLYLSAVLDTLDHCILLNRPQNIYWHPCYVLSWFSSYLTKRTQSVIVDDNVSQVSSISHGVPQGSVLGPILFILYRKPLSDLIQCHSIESQSLCG